MEIRHLRYFIMLSEELHFGKAAKRLFISQPPLSRQIKELELELGATLFSRNNKRVALTPAGEYFLKEARNILVTLDSAKHHANQIHSGLAGEIKIGYISSVDKAKLGILIQRIQKKHPYVQTKLFELPTEKQITALENRKLDIGIIRAPNPSYRLQTEKLYDDGFCLA
ncbi:MAG: LysR family transcriptional regulator, partial [Sphingobacterium sp.]